MSYDISILIDGLILVFLSVTIFYAARLSLFLKSFREGKEGIQLLIRDLNAAIDKSQQAIGGMKKDVANHAEALEEVINEAKFLSDELRFMNESGDSLADRLGKLADRNRELVDLIENAGGLGHDAVAMADVQKSLPKAEQKISGRVSSDGIDDIFEISDFDIDEDDEKDFWALSDGTYRAEQKPISPSSPSPKTSAGFTIFDKELMEVAEKELEEAYFSIQANDVPDDGLEFTSQAERDLYEALQRKKRSKRQVSELS
ncbi:MAG: DUF6468 domain-containing protein [Alphaproteobacteria bacterium]|nr:DUF6468 domain-containing protein [Alphaproteobacteria bacterium]